MWIFEPPGSPGGWMAMLLAVLTLIYLVYAFWRYR
jgi:hypothetical protein